MRLDSGGIDTVALEFADDLADSPWSRSLDSSYCGFCFRWPITTVLWLTIPDCRKYPRLRLVTFAMCIIWIGITSYFVAFLITVVGKIHAVRKILLQTHREIDSIVLWVPHEPRARMSVRAMSEVSRLVRH